MNIKQVLVLCLLFAGISALPVQSQTRVTNPTASNLMPCGLPQTWSEFTSAATLTTFSMTADCTIAANQIGNGAYLFFKSGAFTINGNGHRIIGPPTKWTIYVGGDGSSVTLNLNNVVIEQNGDSGGEALRVAPLGTLNATNVTFRNNSTRASLRVEGASSSATLQNMQFLNNTQTAASGINGSAMKVGIGGQVNFTNGIFRANRNAGSNTAVIAVLGTGSLTLNGCMTFENNVRADGTTAASNTVAATAGGQTGTINGLSGRSACPPQFSYWLSLTPQPKKKSKTTPTPWPSPTARPPSSYQQEYIQLQEETGIDISATHGLASGVHFRQLDGAGIGVQALIDAGPLAAIDVYGYVEQGVEICFPHIGRVIFLDAATMPRTMTALEAWQDDGATCVAIDSPGSLVLLPPE